MAAEVRIYPDASTWTEIASGPLNLPDARAESPTQLFFASTVIAYNHYRIIFPTIKTAGDGTLMNEIAVAEVQFLGIREANLPTRK